MSYTALVLDNQSRQKMIDFFQPIVIDWKVYCHHMTINMGKPKKDFSENLIGQFYTVKIISFADDDLVSAAGVLTDLPSKNPIKHITIAVNEIDGGKPMLSKKLLHWIALKNPIEVSGSVQYVFDDQLTGNKS